VDSAATIDRAALQRAIEDGTVIVVDALPEPAYRRRHLPGALNLTAEDAPAAAGSVLPDLAHPIVAYSTDESCERGPALVAALDDLGYQRVRLYAGGIEDWVGAGLPIEKAA
jgi:rhodanese-related sulfurtransferase